jgi:hypothetical protein
MNINSIRFATVVMVGTAAIALAAAPTAASAPGLLPTICVVAGEAIACPSSTHPENNNFPGAVRPYPHGYLPVLIVGQP